MSNHSLITNKLETDKFYKVINAEIDSKYKYINPVSLESYLKKEDKLKNFINRLNTTELKLSDEVKNEIESVGGFYNWLEEAHLRSLSINPNIDSDNQTDKTLIILLIYDVIEDRVFKMKDEIEKKKQTKMKESMTIEFYDDVLRFESFLLKESIELGESDEEYEKVLADLFHTSLSHVEATDKKLHHYKVDDMDGMKAVAIFSEDDLDKFKKQLTQSIITQTKKETLELSTIKLEKDETLKTNISFSLSDIIDEEKLLIQIDNVLVKNKLLNIMTSWLNTQESSRGKRFHFFKNYHNHFIWKLG